MVLHTIEHIPDEPVVEDVKRTRGKKRQLLSWEGKWLPFKGCRAQIQLETWRSVSACHFLCVVDLNPVDCGRKHQVLGNAGGEFPHVYPHWKYYFHSCFFIPPWGKEGACLPLCLCRMKANTCCCYILNCNRGFTAWSPARVIVFLTIAGSWFVTTVT